MERKALSSVDKYLTEEEILAQSWVFFLAGYETTSTTLTFATYELALNPGAQQRLYDEVTAAFDANDFDGFELRTDVAPSPRGFHLVDTTNPPHLRWRKAGVFGDFGDSWSITLALVSGADQLCGNLIVFRRYNSRDLQLDINLLTSAFATTLADAVQRTAVQTVEFLPSTQDSDLLPAQAG